MVGNIVYFTLVSNHSTDLDAWPYKESSMFCLTTILPPIYLDRKRGGGGMQRIFVEY